MLAQVWSADTGLLQCSCRGHMAEITDLSVSADNSLFASASNDRTVRTWSLQAGHFECIAFLGCIRLPQTMHDERTEILLHRCMSSMRMEKRTCHTPCRCCTGWRGRGAEGGADRPHQLGVLRGVLPHAATRAAVLLLRWHLPHLERRGRGCACHRAGGGSCGRF